MKSIVYVHYNSQLHCYKDESQFIRCSYTSYDESDNLIHVIGMFSSGKFELLEQLELENPFDPEPTFDSMIQFNKTTSVFAYSTLDDKNIIKVVIKDIEYDYKSQKFYMRDFITSVTSIYLNEDHFYDFKGVKASSNSLLKITYDKFALFVNDFKNKNDNNMNSQIVIFIINIYNSNKNINVRHYPIRFKLYDTFIEQKIIGYNLDKFLGVLIESTSPGNPNLKRASFLTFGYMNSTDDIKEDEGTDILINQEQKIKLNKYFNNVENNIFGYEFLGIQIISIPDKEMVGTFFWNGHELNQGQIISINSEISFSKVSHPIIGRHSIIFAPVFGEPDTYEKMNSFCERLESYPKNEGDNEKDFYQPKRIIGKHFTINFNIIATCHHNCKTCHKSSDNIQDQQCIKCIDDYYKVYQTDNCFKTVYKHYLHKELKVWLPCYKDCLTCDSSGDSSKMNCLTCDDNKFDYYKKSKNCLNCPKYVDYEQKNCINAIPEGYFEDKKQGMGIIEKCFELCKTCQEKEETKDGIFYMHCNICKYKNNHYKAKIEGNCPDSESDIEEEEKAKEDEKTEGTGITDDKDEEDDDDNNTTLIILLVLGGIAIIAVAAIIVYKKCYHKINYKDTKTEEEYLNKEEKNIAFDDDDDNQQIN